MDCATACHTDDMAHPIPYEYDHPPAYTEDDKEEGYEDEDEFREEKELEVDSEYEDEQDVDEDREVGGVDEEKSGVMRFLLWVLDVKTDVSV